MLELTTALRRTEEFQKSASLAEISRFKAGETLQLPPGPAAFDVYGYTGTAL
jgi:hypothetical protein